MERKYLTTTEKAIAIMLRSDLNTKMDFANELGISRPTLDTRLEKGNWKRAEEKLINTLYNKLR